MKYLSVCSGIEAATVAWHSLGWEALAFSEIEPFPRKVLSHHYPDVSLHGDFTVLREQEWIKDADILVGGTPCQAFSVAGLRNSLDDDRGNLTLEFVRLADAIDDLRPVGTGAIIVWENVPGVLSVSDNAFGCFLAALVGNDAPLVPTGGKWTNAGMVVGPQRRAAWRVLDAQYFGVAQRRRRVFVVASARDGFDPAEILFEREGMRRHTPPSRKSGQRVAGSFEASAGIRGDEKTIKQYTEEISDTILAKNNQTFGRESPSIVAQTINARMGDGGFDIRSETPIIVGTLGARTGLSRGVQDAESGHLMVAQPIPINTQLGLRGDTSNTTREGIGIGKEGDPSFTLQAGHGHAVAQPIALAENIIGRQPMNGGNGDGFTEGGPMYTLNATGVHGVAQPYSIMPMNSGKDYKARETDVSQPIMAAGPSGGNQGGDYVVQPIAFSRNDDGRDATHNLAPTMRVAGNAGGVLAAAMAVAQPMAFAQNTRDEVRYINGDGQIVGALAAESGMKQTNYIAQTMAVRRLTPRECERLQGFPDDYTNIPGAADGPRYKALGNSMAVPVMAWIGKRIANG